tara:strand:+ start:246 stop:464 length:219 start_codon:yes stop_codon:yes gene_type:complete
MTVKLMGDEHFYKTYRKSISSKFSNENVVGALYSNRKITYSNFVQQLPKKRIFKITLVIPSMILNIQVSFRN